MRSWPLLMSLWLLGCAPEHQVLGRTYDLMVPGNASGPLPLVILVHGFQANGALQDVIFPFSRQVEEARFLYAVPNGTADLSGRRFWNATEGCCDYDALDVDDVAFFRALIADVKSKHQVLPGQVFIVGHSNGGFMGLRLACDAPDLIDGVVSVAGSTWLDGARCPDGRPVPVLLVHGTADLAAPYDGRPGVWPGALETAARFGRRNGCGTTWEDQGAADFLGPASEAETTKQRLTGCLPRGAVDLWTMHGVDHLPRFDARWTRAVLAWLGEQTR